MALNAEVSYNAFLNHNIQTMRPSPTFAVAAKAAARKARGDVVYSFSVGEPSETTPDYVFDGKQKLLFSEDPTTREKYRKMVSAYPPVGGLQILREAVRDKLADENGIAYDASKEITVSTGGKQAIFNAFAVSLQKDDQVLIPEPSWVSYADMVKWQGAKVVPVPTKPDFKFNAETLQLLLSEDKKHKTKWLVMNSPSNPTGAVYTKQELKDIARVIYDENKRREQLNAQTNNEKLKLPPLMVLSDDIYEHMVYEDRYLNKPGDASAISNNVIMAAADEAIDGQPAFDMKPYTVIVNGNAKAFAMTGARVGYAAGPQQLISKMTDFQGLVTSSGAAETQLAATVALSRENKAAREAFFTKQREAYTRRRNLVDEILNKDTSSSISFTPAPAAFYAMLDVTEMCKHLPTPTAGEENLRPANRLANLLVEKYGVALVPGDDFFENPENQGRTFLRMSFATDEGTITKGLEALKQAEKDLVPEPSRRKSSQQARAA
ncbi:MAG: aminotransferase class I/II-fold pyridoxal phosphate-dependent enzyme [Alphaproteobacteria bacterium]|nr:aminotransferase class I/II-fold pyridoxal phosphate-dependent enzyme [Alphaproteobacteria bacterium]